MLFTIGLRIERLLYLGFFLLLLCGLQVYFTAAAAHFSATETGALDSLIAILEQNKSELQSLYDSDRKPRPRDTEREQRVATMREKLGLPAAQSQTRGDRPTYKGKLQDLLISLPGSLDLRGQLGGTLDSAQSPEEILTRLRSLRQGKLQERGTVLGIEAPRLMTLQYGSADFRVSAQPLATGLLLAFYPLLLVWLGSFYITRQRELLGIRSAQDYKEAFPHILNFVAVDFSGLQRRLGFRAKPREARINLYISRFATTFIRCVFVVMAVAPMITGIAYSTVQLFGLLDPPMYFIALAAVAFIIVMLLGLASVIQEALALRGKLFYE